jgi:hypothetical protein
MPYEINSQSPSKHLTIAELREIGEGFVRSVSNYLESDESKTLFDSIEKVRVQRMENWNKFGGEVANKNALAAEGKVLWTFERNQRDAKAAK